MTKRKVKRPAPLAARLAIAQRRAGRLAREAGALEEYLQGLKRPTRSPKYKAFQLAMARYDKASREVDQITRKIASVEKAARTRKAKERAGMPRGIKPDGFVDMNLRGYRGAGLAKTGTQELSTWAKVEHLTKGLRNQDEIARGLNSVLDTLFARVQRYIDQHSIPSRVKGWSIGVQGKFSTDSNPKTRKWIEWPRPVQRQFYKSKRTAHDIGREDIRDLAKGQRKRHDFSGGIHYYQFRVTKLFVFALSTKGGF